MRIPKLLLALLLLASSCKKSGNNDTDDDPGGGGGGGTGGGGGSTKYEWPTQTPLPEVSGTATLTIEENQDYVNAMGDAMPRMPKFPQVSVKAGHLRGFVADLSGKPIKGAYIGVSSTSFGGTHTLERGYTDENGYYEFLLPAGATNISGAGAIITYGEQPGGQAAVGLYPVDGNLTVPPTGAVRNFVLLTYGLASAHWRAEDPSSYKGYFGGTLRIEYVAWERFFTEHGIPVGSEIEVTLSPIAGTTLNGENKKFIVTRKFGGQTILNFIITNLPIGKYAISARLKDGRQLKLQEAATNITLYPKHGLTTTGFVTASELFFYPMHFDKINEANALSGAWRQLPVTVQL
jgi:hypothetical protein